MTVSLPRLPSGTRSALLIAALALAAVLLVPTALAQTQEPAPIQRARQATVFLMQTYDAAGTQVLSCVGSGTLISSQGLILTNAHLAEALGPCRGERIVVALPVRLDEPPVPTYIAEPVQINEELDLAVLQITGGLDGSLISPALLNLPFVNLGDPSGLQPGNGLTFVGYPDIATSSVTATAGVITGITAERSGSRMAWLRTDADLGGGMSGGGAYDAAGRLVGVPTSAPGTSGADPGPMCLSIQDNNHDGLINDRDACVPIGGEITAIRPVVLARPLIEAARGGFRLGRSAGLPVSPPTGEPAVRRLFFAPQVSDLGIASSVVSSLPGGVNSLYLFFDYDNMRPGIPYQVRVTRDGIEMPQFGLGPLAWGGGQRGVWYVGTEGKTWPDGLYEFTILLNGAPTASASITIGAGADAQSFSNLAFGLPGPEGSLTTAGSLLPAGVDRIDAQFDFEGMPDQQAWTQVWYLDDIEVFRQTELWDRGRSGRTTVSAVNAEGLPLGRYRLELFIGERLAATGDVTLAGSADFQRNPLLFSNSRIASDITREGLPAGQTGTSGIVMPLGISSLYAFVDWDMMPAGLEWTYRWFLDGRLIATQTEAWNSGGVGQNLWLSLSTPGPLPEGQYAVEVLVQGRPMFSVTTAIGSGTQPISGIEPEASELLINGTVVDALTGEGIPGALVFFLDVALESGDFTWNEAEIHTQAITDRQGRFDLPRGLTRGRYYTIYVLADDYITLLEDVFIISRDAPSPSSILLEMSRP